MRGLDDLVAGFEIAFAFFRLNWSWMAGGVVAIIVLVVLFGHRNGAQDENDEE